MCFRAIQALEQLQLSRRNDAVRWEVPDKEPLITLETNRYEPGDRRGELNVKGEISWCWDIRPLVRPKGATLDFQIDGNASIKLRIRSRTHDRRDGIAMWRIEMGAPDSPGCHFHTQVLGESNDPPFPHSLSVPRLPAFFVAPTTAIEFLLGELFQEEWAEEMVGDTKDRPYWNSIQRNRLAALLDWKRQRVLASDGSPWLALKKAKPTDEHRLFLPEKRN